MPTVAIIVAAGKGNRAGGKVPKQWRTIAGKLVVDWSIDAQPIKPIFMMSKNRKLTKAQSQTNQSPSLRNSSISSMYPIGRIVIHWPITSSITTSEGSDFLELFLM